MLDAFDECDYNSRKQLIDEIHKLYLGIYPSKRKFLITSRPHHDLELSFRKFSEASAFIRLDCDDISGQISKEIDLVIDHRLLDITDGFTDEDRRIISERLKLMNNRKYLWLSLTFETVEQKGSSRRIDVENILAELSETVSDKYENLLNRSKDQYQTEVLLRIVLAAARPLTVHEANFALTLALRDEQFPSFAVLQSELWPSEDFRRTIKKLCGLFISVHDSKLSFVHQTAREFLLHSDRQGQWQGRFNMRDSHTTMLRSCLLYLTLMDILDFREHGWSVLKRSEPAFLVYAAVSWALHFPKSLDDAITESESANLQMAFRLCDTRSKLYRFWTYLYNHQIHCDFPDSACSLIIMAYFGFGLLIKHSANTHDMDINSEDGRGRTPLSWAAERGYEEVVKLLIGTGKVEVDSEDAFGFTPLSHAARKGHPEVVKLLLDTGKVDVNSKGAGYWSMPFVLAISAGHEKVVRLLLGNSNVDINSKDENGRTRFWRATLYGHEKPVRLLLDTGIMDVNSKDKDGRTPLSWAIKGRARKDCPTVASYW